MTALRNFVAMKNGTVRRFGNRFGGDHKSNPDDIRRPDPRDCDLAELLDLRQFGHNNCVTDDFVSVGRDETGDDLFADFSLGDFDDDDRGELGNDEFNLALAEFERGLTPRTTVTDDFFRDEEENEEEEEQEGPTMLTARQLTMGQMHPSHDHFRILSRKLGLRAKHFQGFLAQQVVAVTR